MNSFVMLIKWKHTNTIKVNESTDTSLLVVDTQNTCSEK